MYINRYTVEGEGTFPLDMLRYAASYPSSSQDVEAMYPNRKEYRDVTLCKRDGTKGDAALTWEGRWASFGWRVVRSEVSKLG